MYLEHFGLGVNPFSLSPKLDFLYKSETFEESMAHLVYGLDNHEAIVLITGAIGTGKTMALQSFLTNLGPRFEFALITNTRVTAIELLKLILEDLGVGLPLGADKSDLLILFKDFLHGASREGKMVLIVVDEAQNLEPEVLEEIRLLTNMGQGEAQPVQIILVGQPELEETVNRPDLAQIRQRIRVHYNLDPLTRQETEEYLNHRMAVAGCGRKVFTSGSIDRIYRGSRGVPRLVNTLAGEALLSAFVAGHEMVQPGDIEEDQDLRFETGSAHIGEQASPAPVVSPSKAPLVQVPREQEPPAPMPAPVMAQRNSRKSGPGKAGWAWGLGALAVVVLGALYSLGTLDGLVAAWVPDPETESEVIVAQPSPVTAEVDNSIVDQAEIPVEIPVEAPVETPEEAPMEIPADIPAETQTETAPAVGDGFYVHIFSFRTPERAKSFVNRWGEHEYGITTRSQDIRGATWYRVFLGPFTTRNQALMAALRLQQDGTIDYYKINPLLPGQGI